MVLFDLVSEILIFLGIAALGSCRCQSALAPRVQFFIMYYQFGGPGLQFLSLDLVRPP